MKKASMLLLVSILMILLSGCEKIPQQNESTAPSAQEETSNETVETPTVVEVTPSLPSTLAYIKAVYEKDGKTYLTIDEAKWLTELDGTCGIESATLPKCSPNGFLIENSDKTTKDIELSDANMDIKTTNLGADPSSEYAIKLPEFVKLLESNKDYFEIVPFNITIQDEKVISIVERYVP